MFSPYSAYGNPFYNSSPFYNHPQRWGQPSRRYDIDDDERLARARALAEQRARRAQWLPDEDEEDDNDWAYHQLGPRERMYVDAARRKQQLERQQQEQEVARQRALEEKRREEQRWQEQLEQRQREEDERRHRILEEQRRVQQQKREQAWLRAEAQRQKAQSRSRTSSAASGPTQIPIRSTSPTPAPRSPSPPRKSPTPQPQYDERHEAAATLIQNQYRIHKSFQAIHDFESQFEQAKSRFTLPSSIDFQKPSGEGHITVPAADDDSTPMEADDQVDGKLAYTSANYNLHAYAEALLKLLTKLDSVESWGDKDVRTARRAVVKRIEEEISRVERWWKTAWRQYLASEKAKMDLKDVPIIFGPQ